MTELEVCIGTACHLNGSYNVIQTFQQLIEEYSLHEEINLKASFCMKQCQNKGVSISVGAERYQIEPENAGAFFKDIILKKLQAE